MGIVAKQASRNAFFILLGTIFGAVNNVVVLPLAFENFKSGLGLIVLLVSLSVVFSQFLSFSTSNILVNYLPKIDSEKEQNGLVKKLLVSCTFGVLLFVLGLFLGKELFLSWLSVEDAALMRGHLVALTVLTASLIYFQLFKGYLQANFKSVLISILNDPFLKGIYLLVATLFFFEIISFDVLLILFVSSYAMLAVITFFSAKNLGLSLTNSSPFTRTKELMEYAFYSILDKGAGIFVHRLDILMISFILDLSFTAEYAIAYFIGTVVLIPFKSISTIASPIVSKEIGAGNMVELNKLLKSSTLYALTAGGFIFSVIWINGESIFQILPEKFSNGLWVVFFIGLARLFHMFGGINGAIILYSNYFKFNLVLNLFLVILTFITNLIFIPRYGIGGAAFATCISLAVFSIGRMIFVFRKFRLHPLSKKLLMLTVLVVVLIVVFLSLPVVHQNPFVEIIIKGTMFSIVYFLGLRLLKVIPELNSFSEMKNLLAGK